MNGVLLADKPAGTGSAEAVRKIKALVRPSRVGHLGTLDPFATGLLPILIGEATKLAPFLQDAEKEYAGVIQLGVETDTLDPTGAVMRNAEIPAIDSARLQEVTTRFTGKILQQPPIFSAIKRDGVPMYKLARRGVEVEPPAPREVEISRFQLNRLDSTSLRFVAVCSTGTYMRALARDIGVALDTVAHLSELRRTRSGSFSVDQAYPLDKVLAMLSEGRESELLVGLSEALAAMPKADAGPLEVRMLRNGDSRALDGMAPSGARLFKVVSGRELIAVAEATSRVTARVLRVFGN